MKQTACCEKRYTDREMKALLVSIFSPPVRDKQSRVARLLFFRKRSAQREQDAP
ncbi:MAG: hypothetical protein IJC29_00980 [Clostridia bacterium]|nr:hypothetical protein [Clostridia bacterium]